MTQDMREAIDRARQSATTNQPARIGPWVSENVFWSLRCAQLVNDSGYLTPAGLSA